MGALSLRLPDNIDAALTREAKLEERPRSEVVRLAIVEYLQRVEKERFMAQLAGEARLAYADPTIRQDALEIAEAGVDDGLDAIIAAEQQAGIDPDDKWWR